VTFAGTFSDNAGDVHTAQWALDGYTVSGTVNEAARTVTATYAFSSAGVYFVKLTVSDQCANATTATTVGGFDAMVVIYDPNAGFVTGGGWITSPPGAYQQDTTLAGMANFGFVSKYKKGASAPTGETEFQFKLGNLNFHSTSYDWLVIAGAKAQYKGSGTINNAGDYGFMLTAIDGQMGGGGGIDKFRMKIVNKTTSAVMYDNQFGTADSATPSTALGGGSIVIHTSGGGASAGLSREAPDAEPPGGLPESFGLAQNYPNPFNPSTSIRYALPVDAVVTLRVYNVIGQEVATLLNAELQAAGYRQATFDASALPSGIYFYQITAIGISSADAAFAETRKMLLVR
jgi:hypothetical protein